MRWAIGRRRARHIAASTQPMATGCSPCGCASRWRPGSSPTPLARFARSSHSPRQPLPCRRRPSRLACRFPGLVRPTNTPPPRLLSIRCRRPSPTPRRPSGSMPPPRASSITSTSWARWVRVCVRGTPRSRRQPQPWTRVNSAMPGRNRHGADDPPGSGADRPVCRPRRRRPATRRPCRIGMAAPAPAPPGPPDRLVKAEAPGPAWGSGASEVCRPVGPAPIRRRRSPAAGRWRGRAECRGR